MIDIQKLKPFPLAFKAFEGYIEKEHGSVLFIYNGSGVVRNEDVVEFLDKHKVFATQSILPNKIEWIFNVVALFNSTSYSEVPTRSFDTRNEAVNESLLKAFELLENKLKTN